MLVLSELVADQARIGRILWICLGDEKQAFPRTDRSDLLVLVYNGPQLRQGTFALLADIMAEDIMNIFLSGHVSTSIHNGLPEGGSLGTLLYTTLPDSLTRFLLAEGFGVGINVVMPAAWRGHEWC